MAVPSATGHALQTHSLSRITCSLGNSRVVFRFLRRMYLNGHFSEGLGRGQVRKKGTCRFLGSTIIISQSQMMAPQSHALSDHWTTQQGVLIESAESSDGPESSEPNRGAHHTYRTHI